MIDPELERYFECVARIVDAPLSTATTVRRVEESLAGLLARSLDLPAEYRRLPERGHGRNLVHRDPGTGFVVVAMVWPPGADSRPHDHGAWGVVGVVEGELFVTDYEREDDGAVPGRARLREVGTQVANAGSTCCALPPHRDVHRVQNRLEEPALSLHTYEREITRCTLFDLESGATELAWPKFTNVAAARR